MKAIVLTALNKLEFQTVPQPIPAPSQAVVSLRAAALNHRDLWIALGKYPGIQLPIILGSDGAGVVSQVGPDTDPQWLNKEVVINPGVDWGTNPNAQSDQFTILGLPQNGTLAQQVCVPISNLHHKPSHLNWHQAAALPLAALTAFRALFSRAKLQPSDKLLITGVGGGVAHFALQFALAIGAQTAVTSGSDAKLQRALSLGAKFGVNYKDPNWAENLLKQASLFDVVIDSTAGDSVNQLLDLTAPAGRIVFFGATAGNPHDLDWRKMFWRQISLLGSTMGSPSEFLSMLDFVSKHKIKPIIDQVFPLEQATQAFLRMQNAKQFGKIVLAS